MPKNHSQNIAKIGPFGDVFWRLRFYMGQFGLLCHFLTFRALQENIARFSDEMGVVMDISDRVVVLDYGKVIGDGTPDEVRSNQTVIDAYLGVAHG